MPRCGFSFLYTKGERQRVQATHRSNEVIHKSSCLFIVVVANSIIPHPLTQLHKHKPISPSSQFWWVRPSLSLSLSLSLLVFLLSFSGFFNFYLFIYGCNLSPVTKITRLSKTHSTNFLILVGDNSFLLSILFLKNLFFLGIFFFFWVSVISTCFLVTFHGVRL